MTYPIFRGNCPKNVSRDAKYRIRSSPTGLVVELTYETDRGETWLPTTEDHPELASMVNLVKVEVNERKNGAFYINEHHQVIVPDMRGTYYLAGEYDRQLRFHFEGHVLSGDGKSLAGRRLAAGDEWDGPHPGIPYRLAAGARDIYYKIRPRLNVSEKIHLSKFIGKRTSVAVAATIATQKGHDGGRFYVNEWRQIFAPINGPSLSYVYLGELDIDRWFPKA